MWFLFTQSAKSTVYYAQEEAIRLGYIAVEPEQILLGLVSTHTGEDVADTAAVHILGKLGIPCALIRQDFTGTIASNRAGIDLNHVRLSDRTIQVIDNAYKQRRALGDTHLGTEHLLLGVACDEALQGNLASLGLRSAAIIDALCELRADLPQPWWQFWRRLRLEP